MAFGVASALLALSGESVFSMLESSYAMGAAPWLVLTAGLWTKCRPWTGAAILCIGLVAWGMEMLGFATLVPSIIWVLLLGAVIFVADTIVTKLTARERAASE